MDPYKAARMARQLMNEHGLGQVVFQWDRGKRRRGQMLFSRHTKEAMILSLSRPLTELRDEAEVRNTILHEIAHAKVGPGHGHDAVWKRMALKVGARPVRCSNDGVEVRGKFVLVCDRCGETVQRYKIPRVKRTYQHLKCGGMMQMRRHDGTPLFKPRIVVQVREHAREFQRAAENVDREVSGSA